MVHAFVTYTLNFRNTLILVYGLPASPIRRLQLVQKAVARGVAKYRKIERITRQTGFALAAYSTRI